MPPPTQPEPAGTPPPGTFAAAALSGTLAGTAAGVTPGVAIAPPVVAVREGTLAVLRGFRRFLRMASRRQAAGLFDMLRREHPEEPEDALRALVREEQDREREFTRKMLERLARDIPAALAIPDPEARRQRVHHVVERERRYVLMREQAMAERALQAVEHRALERVSPRGAFWMLSDDVRNHTPGCLALAGRFWPHEVLRGLHPPLHPGCKCFLISEQEAAARDLLTPDMIPDTADAIARAAVLARRAKALDEAVEPWEVDEFLAELEEARVRLRWPRGTIKGGEFRPRRGGTPGARTLGRRALERLISGDREGRWVGIGGRRVFVPSERRFERTIGGRRYVSPPGGTNVYRDGELIDSPLDDGGEAPGRPGAVVGPPRMDASRAAVLRRAIERLRPVRVPAAAKPPEAEPKLRSTPPRTFAEFIEDTDELSAYLAWEHQAPVELGSVSVSRDMWDHSGWTNWNGDITFGADVRPNVLRDIRLRESGGKPRDADLRSMYAVYKVQAHEASHRVNPITPAAYGKLGAEVLEEALAEEVAHRLAIRQLHRHGRDDVLRWALEHPDDRKVAGSYQGYRRRLMAALDAAGVPEGERERAIFELKFRVSPEERAEWLADRSGEKVEDVIVSLAGPPLSGERRRRADPGTRAVPEEETLALRRIRAMSVGGYLPISQTVDGEPASVEKRSETDYVVTRGPERMRAGTSAEAAMLAVGSLPMRGWSGGPPADLSQMRMAAEARAEEIAARYSGVGNKLDSTLSAIDWLGSGERMIDHNGRYSPDSGQVTLAPGVGSSLAKLFAARAEGRPLTPDEQREGWLAFKTLQHELAHSVNPTTTDEYQRRGSKALEEALTEELAAPLAVEWMRQLGFEEPLEWVRGNPRHFNAEGTYQGYRVALRNMLSKARIPEAEWPETLARMKFQMTAGERMDFLADVLDKAGAIDRDTRYRDRLEKARSLKVGESDYPEDHADRITRTPEGYRFETTFKREMARQGVYSTPEEAVEAVFGMTEEQWDEQWKRAEPTFLMAEWEHSARDLENFEPLIPPESYLGSYQTSLPVGGDLDADFVRMSGGVGATQEALWDPTLHPRGRRGQFIDVPGVGKLRVIDPMLAEKLSSGRWRLRAGEPKEDRYGKRIPVLITPKADRAVRGGRPRRMMGGAREAPFVDPEVAMVDGEEVRLKPGWSEELPLRDEPDLMYRGISKAELDAIERTGEIRSTGLYNVGGEAQRGTTSFAVSPETAQSYASGFAPWHLAPTFDEPGYIIAVRRGELPESRLVPSEIDAPVLPSSAIVDVVEVRPYETLPGDVDVNSASMYGAIGDRDEFVQGSGSAPSSRYAYRRAAEVLGRTRADVARELVSGETPVPRSEWLPKPKYSSAVRKIKNADDAERYFKGLGITAHLHPQSSVTTRPDGRVVPGQVISRERRDELIENDAGFFRQIAQAVTDAVERYPVLRDGEYPLVGIRFAHARGQPELSPEIQGLGLDGTWASTGPDPTGDSVENRRMLNVPAPRWIVIQEDNNKLAIDHDPIAGNGLAISDQTPYGQMMHELGHAVAAATGIEFFGGRRAVPRVLSAARAGPFEASMISPYGANAAPEFWGELFSMINTPGALERVSPEAREVVERVRTAARDYAARYEMAPAL